MLWWIYTLASSQNEENRSRPTIQDCWRSDLRFSNASASLQIGVSAFTKKEVIHTTIVCRGFCCYRVF